MRGKWILLLSLTLVPVLASCSTKRTRSHSFEVIYEDGVHVATNTGGPKYSEELFQYEKVLELQQDESNPESLLHNATSLFTDKAGFFFVEDQFNVRIAVFDPTGHYVRSIGRKGNGPGEFSMMWKLMGLNGDVLTIYDLSLARTTLYRTDGTLLDVFSYSKAISLASSQHRTPEGYLVIINEPFQIQDNLRYSGVGFLTLSAEMDTLGSAETPLVPTMCRYLVPVMGIEQSFWIPMPYAPHPEAVYVAGRGVLLSTGAEPILFWYALDGTLIQKVLLDLPDPTLTEREKDAYLEALDRRIEELEGRRKESQIAIRKGLIFPEAKAYWSITAVDDAGYVWLGIPESPEERERAGGGRIYRLLSPEGEYLGITRAPARGLVMGRRLLAVITDPETDEDIPTVWRLVPAVKGFIYP